MRKLLYILGGIIALIVIIAIVGGGEERGITPAQQLPQKEVEKEEPKKEIIESGIGVSRKSIMDILEKPALGFSFSEGEPANGKENYVAQEGANVIQLLGKADNLSEASIIALLGSDAGENLLSLTMIVGFANIIDNNSTDWITNEFQKIIANPTKSYSNTKVFDKNLFEISFSPSPAFNLFSLIITPAK